GTVCEIFGQNGATPSFARGRHEECVPIRGASDRRIGKRGPNRRFRSRSAREQVEPVGGLSCSVAWLNNALSGDGCIEFGNRLQCQPTIEPDSVLDDLAGNVMPSTSRVVDGIDQQVRIQRKALVSGAHAAPRGRADRRRSASPSPYGTEYAREPPPAPPTRCAGRQPARAVQPA